MSLVAGLAQQGVEYGWLYVPSAIALGALHGLEPGHSKTLMASFIIAINGSIRQAILLGLCATFSHTLIVWLVALIGMYWGSGQDAHASEPYFQLLSGLILIAMGSWMFWRMRKHTHHSHPDEHSEHYSHDHTHDDHAHAGEDAHAQAHAADIAKRFTGQQVTNMQIAIFGLTGGLIPCPAAITVLLVCMQMKQITLGVALVLCFSTGLALTLVASGVIAALGIRAASRKFHWLPNLLHRAPYVAGIITLMLGITLVYDASSLVRFI